MGRQSIACHRRLRSNIQLTLVSILIRLQRFDAHVMLAFQRLIRHGNLGRERVRRFVEAPLKRTYLGKLNRPDTIVSSWATAEVQQLDCSVCQPVFELDLPEGRCVGLKLSEVESSNSEALTPDKIRSQSHWIHKMLHPKEVDFGVTQPNQKNRNSFFLGRLAMREALRLQQDAARTCSILKDEYGRPRVPEGYLGSISHKKNIGVALISSCSSYENGRVGLGVDVEQVSQGKRNVARKVLTPNEIDALGRLEGISKEQEVLLRFSLKETLYKALHPLVCDYVGFQEVEVTPNSDGTASVTWKMKSGDEDLFGEVSAHWTTIEDGSYFLTTGRVTIA